MKTFEVMLKTLMDISNSTTGIGKIQKQLNKLKLPSTLAESFNNNFKELESSIIDVQNRLKVGFKTKTDVSGFEKSLKKVDNIISDIITDYNSIDSDILRKSLNLSGLEKFQTLSQIIHEYNEELNKIKQTDVFKNVINSFNTLNTLTKANPIKDFFNSLQAGDIKGMDKALQALEKRIVDTSDKSNKLYFKTKEKQDDYNKAVLTLKGYFNDLVNNTDINKITTELSKAKRELNNFEVENIKKLQTEVEEAGIDLNNLQHDFRNVAKAEIEAADNSRKMSSEMDNLKNQVEAFFGISNTIEIFKRTIRSAYETVRELDKAMTETAVVTDFSVGDMWEALPRYTTAANELGTTTLGAYETMTLFYQQGLKTNEVFEIGTETMKMARIANMDYTKATDLMTAALRGFNMELNEVSAKRINDVYSELAAITAADTEEIADAMTRTASIANSAGMEFETTSAFLSQMIETTREAPENLGTAMKTIVARFQELKKAPSEIGEIDGEIVDANKIEGALRTIGISLRDTTGQFRDLDDVFLEIAKKWDSLDKNTQRYIATTAAGSRQQSRFIAMMSNYERTMELVDAANNSAGASQRQFEKTVESLESKLNKLKNAWNEFAMGIANNQIIKLGIDTLTGLITVVNKVTSVFGETGSSILKTFLAIKSLSAGKKILGTFLNSLSQVWTTTDKNGEISSVVTKKIINDNSKAALSVKTLNASYLQLEKTLFNLSNKFKAKSNKAVTNFIDPSLFSLLNNNDGFNFISDENLDLDQTMSLIYIEQYKELLPIKEQMAILTNKEAMAKLQEAAINGTLNDSLIKTIALEAVEKGTLEKGIAIRIKETAIKLFSSKATDKLTLANTLLAGSQLKVIKSSTGLIGKLANMPLGKLTILVAGLTLAFTVLYKVWKNNTPEAQLDRARKATEKAKEAAEETKTAYDNLLTNFDNYDEAQSKIDSLTKGTLEWKEALLESNQAVLDLLQTYPELASYISNENGKLTISKEGRNLLLDQQLKAVENTQKILGITQANQANLEGQAKQREILERAPKIIIESKAPDSLRRNLSGGAETNIQAIEADDIIKELANAYAKGSNEFAITIEEVKNRVEEADMEELISLAIEYAGSIVETEKTIETALGVGLNNERNNSKYGEEFVNGFIKGFNIDNYDELLKRKTSTFKGKAESALENLYKENFGTAIPDIYKDAEGKIDKEAVAGMLAQNELAKELEKQLDETYQIISSTVSNSEKEILIKLLNGDVLSEEEIEIIGGIDELDNWLESIGFTTDKFEELSQKLGYTSTELKQGFDEVITNSINFVDEFDSYFLGALKSEYAKPSNFSSNALSTMKRISGLGNGGKDFLTGIMNQIDSEEIAEQINTIFSGANIATEEGIKAFVADLEKAGVSFGNFENAPEQAAEQLIRFAGLVNDVNESIIGSLKNLYDLADKIIEKNQRTFEQEEYDKIIGLNPFFANDFEKIGDQWIYVGESAYALADALRKAAEEETNDLQKKILSNNYTEEDRQNYIAAISQNASGQDILNDPILSQNEEEQKRVLDARIRQEEGLLAKVNQIEKAEGEITKEKKAQLLDTNKLDKKYKNLIKTLDDSQDAFDNKNSTDYFIAIEDVATKLSDIFNYDVGTNFVEKNLSSIQKLTEGGKTAEAVFKSLKAQIQSTAEIEFNKLIDEGVIDVKGINKALEDSGSNIKDFAKWINDLDPTLTGKADMSQILTAVYNSATYTEEQFSNIVGLIEQLTNTTISFDYEYQPFDKIPPALKGVLGSITPAFKILQQIPKKIKVTSVTQNDSNFPSFYPKGASSDSGSKDKDKVSLPDYGEPLDYLYNLIKKINKELRLRNKYEKEYERYLNDNSKNSKDIGENIKKQYENYQKIISDSQKASSSRTNKISSLLNQKIKYRTTDKDDNEIEKTSKYKLSRYIKYNKETNQVNIDWKKLESLRTSKSQSNRDLYSEIVEHLQTIEGYESDIEGYEDNIEDAVDALVELEKIGHDAFVDFENRVYNAIIKREQDKIDKLSQINTSINDSNQDLLDTIQSNLSKIRQERDNKKTEEDIASKERRLAYLRQDTSGANQLEIKQLEEEIAQQKQDYTDTLIDQKISELQDQNDLAANQRQQQIDLMQAQLDYDEKIGAFWKEAHNLMERDLDELTGLVHGSELEQLLQSAEGFAGMSQQQQMNWFEDTEKTIKEMWHFMQNNWNTAIQDKNTLLYDITSGAVNYGDKITATNSNTGENINGFIDDNKNLSTQQGANDKQWFEYSSDQIYKDEDGNYITEQDKRNARRFKPGTVINVRAKKKNSDDEIVIVKAVAGPDGLLRNGNTVYTDLSVTTNQNPNHYYTKKAQKIQERTKGNTIKFAAYKTGGIADFTGPAWLDGTKSKPEMVLNQKDTQNFIQLKDILRDLLTNNDRNNRRTGDNYYEVNIEVDSLGSDYDVEQMATKIKKMIVNDSKYRNVNAVNFIR